MIPSTSFASSVITAARPHFDRGGKPLERLARARKAQPSSRRIEASLRDEHGGRCDVIVVGGGITGSAAGLALAKKGARVVVCEAETVGQAA